MSGPAGARRIVHAVSDHSALCTLHSALCTRRRSASALTLIEILIAMFIFLVGGLGILSLFPVAMNNAGRVLGETRGNIIAQSVVAQLTADCRVNFELPTTGSAVANTTTYTPSSTTLTRQIASTSKNQYFVTLLDGPGRGQSRFITNDPGGTGPITVAPAWTQVAVADANGNLLGTPWNEPGDRGDLFPNQHYSITRMGLPERPLYVGEQIQQSPPQPYYVSVSSVPPTTTYNYGTFGLNRDLAVRSFVSGVPNGFYAGIAYWLASPNTPTVIPFLSDSKSTSANITLTNVPVSPYLSDPPNTYGYLQDSSKNWTSNLIGTNIRIISGNCAGQVRTIIGNSTGTLKVAPPWTLPLSGATGTAYEIGWANTTAVSPTPPGTTWCAQLYSWGGSSTVTCSGITLTDPSPPWPSNANLQGKYVYIYGVPGAGQACAIVSNTATQLTVTPAFAGTGSSNYVITDSHGYVLITSGRATNRLFPIVWDENNGNGHLIVCAGANFQSLSGITAAGPLGTSAPYQYNLQNATTFTVIGNQSPRLDQSISSSSPFSDIIPSTPMILNAVPDGTPLPLGAASATQPYWPAPWQSAPSLWPPPWFNTLNIVGHPNRLALDQYGNSGSYTSDYSYGVVFSDSGTDPSLPVRVDVFVWRNFDINKDFAQNQKPVGHMAGYIKRP
jgi:hypothetical protein